LDFFGIHLVRVFQAAFLLGLLRTLVRGLSIAARLVAANLDTLRNEVNFTLKTVDLTLNRTSITSPLVLGKRV
jgi:hypothetical protein